MLLLTLGFEYPDSKASRKATQLYAFSKDNTDITEPFYQLGFTYC